MVIPNAFKPDSKPIKADDSPNIIKEMMAGIKTLMGETDFNFLMCDMVFMFIVKLI
jgi:hypothetical protein